MKKYLLTISETIGNRYSAEINVLVKATDPGYAKYHWHKAQNNLGSTKEGDHEYANYDLGYRSKLESVKELSDNEQRVMEGVLPEIEGFNP